MGKSVLLLTVVPFPSTSKRGGDNADETISRIFDLAVSLIQISTLTRPYNI